MTTTTGQTPETTIEKVSAALSDVGLLDLRVCPEPGCCEGHEHLWAVVSDRGRAAKIVRRIERMGGMATPLRMERNGLTTRVRVSIHFLAAEGSGNAYYADPDQAAALERPEGRTTQYVAVDQRGFLLTTCPLPLASMQHEVNAEEAKSGDRKFTIYALYRATPRSGDTPTDAAHV